MFKTKKISENRRVNRTSPHHPKHPMKTMEGKNKLLVENNVSSTLVPTIEFSCVCAF